MSLSNTDRSDDYVKSDVTAIEKIHCPVLGVACQSDKVRGKPRVRGHPTANCRVSCKWSHVVQEVRFKVHDPKAHSKGGTLENTINGRADEESAGAPQHIIHPSKDITKLYGMSRPCTHFYITF